MPQLRRFQTSEHRTLLLVEQAVEKVREATPRFCLGAKLIPPGQRHAWAPWRVTPVLREFTRRITTSLRPYDAVGRYGGEEFLVVLRAAIWSPAGRHAERLRNFDQWRAVRHFEGRHTATCSLGVASTSASTPKDTDSLIREADAALYRAKRNGRNRVEALNADFSRP